VPHAQSARPDDAKSGSQVRPDKQDSESSAGERKWARCVGEGIYDGDRHAIDGSIAPSITV
jgi:hypothetical protein